MIEKIMHVLAIMLCVVFAVILGTIVLVAVIRTIEHLESL